MQQHATSRRDDQLLQRRDALPRVDEHAPQHLQDLVPGLRMPCSSWQEEGAWARLQEAARWQTSSPMLSAFMKAPSKMPAAAAHRTGIGAWLLDISDTRSGPSRFHAEAFTVAIRAAR